MGIDIIHFASFDQRKNSCGPVPSGIRPCEGPIFSADSNHAFILPMSDKTSRSIIAGILCTGAVFHSNISSSGPVALLFT